MKLAPTPTCALRTAQGGWLARVLRAGAAGMVLAVVASGPALAQRHGDHDRGDPRVQDQRPQQDQRGMPDPRAMPQRAPEQVPQRFEPRAFDSREFDDRRQDPGARQDPRRPSRMTPDERRDLRRQINEAGIDLYAHPPRH
ncbi:MAG: hypothetical protein ACXWC4_23240 [Telluria sp.]